MSLIKQHLHQQQVTENNIYLELPLDDVEYLLSLLDEEPQGSRAYAIREEIFLQVYE